MINKVIHTLGHIWNMENFVSAHTPYEKIKPSLANSSEEELLAGLISTLSLLPTTPNGTYINPVRSANSNSIIESIKLLPGSTGLLLVILLCMLASTASTYIRRSLYNLFWYAHILFAFSYYVLFCVHGLGAVVRKQTNIDKNNPSKCYRIYSDWSSQSRVCDIPQFAGSSASSYIWVIAPIIVYLIERLMRFLRSFRNYNIIEYNLHPSDVLEIKIDNSKKYLNYRAGQYIYINLPKIAFFEWHPFTVTSSPDDSYLSVHIRCCGDWTNKLKKALVGQNTQKSNLSNIKIDGPYGTCAEDVFKYSKVILIGAGIGVTPYASILKHIWHSVNPANKSSNSSNRLGKVYFFWICPSIDTFEWFGQLLQQLEIEMRNANKQDLLEYKIYLTRGWSLREAKQIALNERDSYDLFTGLKQKTNYGRPNFELFFKELVTQETSSLDHSVKKDVGVFFCGSQSLSTQLHKLSNKYSNESVRIFYNKENF
jgi:hypothetical protein